MGAFGGGQPRTALSSACSATLRTFPADGTYVCGLESGRFYSIAMAAPICVRTSQAVAGVGDYLDCASWSALDGVTGAARSVNVAGWAPVPNSTDAVTIRVIVDGVPVGTAAGGRPTRLERPSHFP